MSGILILCATEFEIVGFLARYPKAGKQTLKSGQILYTNPESPWSCLITGPGVFNTAMGLASYFEHHTPSLVLHTGIAGAYEGAGLSIGDIAVATREQYLHTGVGNDPLNRSSLPFELIPGQPETREGLYRFEPDLVETWTDRLEQASGQVKGKIVKGPFLTVSALTRGLAQADKLHDRFSPVMEAMEGAAAAHVSQCYRVPMIEVRAASNLAGERDKSKWDVQLACRQVAWICKTFLK